MMASRFSPEARTTVWGWPIGWSALWKSLPPTATTRRPERSRRSQSSTASSSWTVQAPFHTSMASISEASNSQPQPLWVRRSGWLQMATPPAPRTRSTKRRSWRSPGR